MEAQRSLDPKFVTSVAAERDRLIALVESLVREAEKIQAELDSARSDIEMHMALVRELDDLLGYSSQLRLDLPVGPIGGRQLREIAIEILRSRGDSGAVHYRDWYAWLEEAGYRASGQNPAATFLAQISQDHRVERVGSKSGRYRLAHSE